MINATEANKIAYRSYEGWKKEAERIEKLIADASKQGFMFTSTTVGSKDMPYIEVLLKAKGFKVTVSKEFEFSRESCWIFDIDWRH